MPEKSEVEKEPTPTPKPVAPPIVPTVAAEKTNEGSIFWTWLPVPICIAYDDLAPINKMGRLAAEEKIIKLLKAQISSARKQKGKDEWVLKVQYPTDPGTIVDEQLKRAVGQIRSAIGECV